jgi:hypothetical protein
VGRQDWISSRRAASALDLLLRHRLIHSQRQAVVPWHVLPV